MRVSKDSRQRILDTLHELDVQILTLVRIPFAGLGEFGVRFRGEPKNDICLARLCEFRLDLVPCTTLGRIASDPLHSPIKFPFLSICEFERFILFGDCVPDFFD